MILTYLMDSSCKLNSYIIFRHTLSISRAAFASVGYRAQSWNETAVHLAQTHNDW